MSLTATETARLGELDSLLADQSLDASTPADLFAVVDALDATSALRRALTDPATPAEARQQMAERLLQGKVGGQSIWIVRQAVALRWGSGRGLADALERQAVRGMLLQAQAGGFLDEVTEQLYAFGTTVTGDAGLRDALADARRPLAARQQLVRQLLDGKAHGWVVDLSSRAAAGRRGDFEKTIEGYLELAADVRDRDVAHVTVARPLDEDQADRLRRALTRINGREVDLQVVVDASVIGGVRVELGNEIIEGTVADRLHEVRRQLS